MWCHRRVAYRAAGEGHNLTSPMQQTSVERWLEEQSAPSEAEQYAQDIWYVSIHLISFTCRCSGSWPQDLLLGFQGAMM